jgi:hypothetical protein
MRLENAKIDALKRLASTDREVKLSALDDGRTIWLGMGYCVGKGWAVYRGDDCYMITTEGRKALRELTAEA